MITRENVRSGRKANFYITENSFIDNYAKTVGPVCALIYNVLERYMNCETRSTWVGTAKIAEVVGVTQRTVQRCLKTLEEFKLIRILKTATTTIYVVVPVPPREKTRTAPLFDSVDDDVLLSVDDSAVVEATAKSQFATTASHIATPQSHQGDVGVAAYKDEQDFFNKTNEQQVGNLAPPSIHKLAGRVASMVSLPLTSNNIRAVEAAIEAEADRTGQSQPEAAEYIAKVARDDAEKGVPVNKYYFEDAKWRLEGRAHGRVSRAEQRKLNNLEINERFQQRLKQRFGTP